MSDAPNRPNLRPREQFVFDLLARAKAPMSRWQLVDVLAPGACDANVPAIHISRLRRKLGHDAIRTIRGEGYVLTEAGRLAVQNGNVSALA